MIFKMERVEFPGATFDLPVASEFPYHGMTYRATGINILGKVLNWVFLHVPVKRGEPARFIRVKL